MRQLPERSLISVTRTGRDVAIVISRPINGSAFGGGIFLIAWLGGWAYAAYAAIQQLMNGRGLGGPSSFLMIWLVGWTIGGVFAALQLKRIFTPPRPEKMITGADGLTYDAGTSSDGRAEWRRREPVQIDRKALSTMRLRDAAGQNRLTVDVGLNRLEIGQAATDIEREWLYELISERYGFEAPAVEQPAA